MIGKIVCSIKGHKLKSEFLVDPETKINLERQWYCKRCGTTVARISNPNLRLEMPRYEKRKANQK